MHHENYDETDDKDTLDTHIKVDGFLESLEACIVFQ